MENELERIISLEKRIKLLEENLSWMQKDLGHLIDIVESLEPETHYHITYHFQTVPCMDDPNNTNDLNDFI
jgi:hypothetical protein